MSDHIVEIVEVSPRDGLQNEASVLATADKVALVHRALAAGLRRIEVTSFVNPKRVPQMADAETLLERVHKEPALRSIGLVLNARGFERAVSSGCGEINFVVVASETFNRRNQGSGIADTLTVWREVAKAAHAGGLPISLTIGASFGCPFEGEVPTASVLSIIDRALEASPTEIALADTIGCGVPSQVRDLLKQVSGLAPSVPLRCHFHNTRSTGLANVVAAIEAGCRIIDASIGGIGGCPFAPRATGNVATEDVIYMLERMGMTTGVDLSAVIETSRWLEQLLGKPIQSGVGRAGAFPITRLPNA